MEKLLKAVLLLLVVVACSSAQTDGLPGNSLQCMVDIANKNTISWTRERSCNCACTYNNSFINCTTKITIYKIRSKTEMLSVEVGGPLAFVCWCSMHLLCKLAKWCHLCCANCDHFVSCKLHGFCCVNWTHCNTLCCVVNQFVFSALQPSHHVLCKLCSGAHCIVQCMARHAECKLSWRMYTVCHAECKLSGEE